MDQISNTGTIADDAANGADPTPANNSASDTTPVDAAPDLTIAKEYVGPTPFPGDTIAFDLDYANDGNQDATGVTLHEEVPANTTFDAGASTAGWSCADGSPAGTLCDLAIGPLAGAGGGGSAVFAVELDDPLPPGTDEFENCAAIADSLLETELFGHARGSFTGAYRDKVGRLEAAHRGTLFLDEIGEMSVPMQTHLLRFLESGEIQRVGHEGGPRRVDVRVICATNRELGEAVAAGTPGSGIIRCGARRSRARHARGPRSRGSGALAPRPEAGPRPLPPLSAAP